MLGIGHKRVGWLHDGGDVLMQDLTPTSANVRTPTPVRFVRFLVSRRWWLLLFLASSARFAFACDCTLVHVPVDPLEPTRKDIFLGKGKTVELRFHNENMDREVDVFPEPPLTVFRPASGQTCEIEGGVWVRRSVYLSTDDNTLLVQEFSGSNDSLVLYDTASCNKRSTIDVSGARWKLSGSRITVGRQCSGEDLKTCRSVTEFVLDKFCKPKQTRATKREGSGLDP